MRRAIAIAVTGISLAGCSSFSLDSFKPTPPPVQVQIDSVPPGADATTSLGPGCKTPCTVTVPAPDAGFAVTFALPRFQPVTVPVQVIRNPGDFANPATTVIEPSPVFAELKPAGPPPKVRKPMRPKPKAAGAPADAGSPLPATAPATR
ncbi:hypothetical protein [Afipia sp. GAS231]|uniref:hypothetical protein n=1 Tax=Afipia sp. GAS231 TaxID=1882747 RepID=UPI00087B3E8E|nr:hypothetical protein [Afipia sp. GAS231]SDP29505.1 hypothetical protein SAMN05444050_6390 [Afipia sp. GAS231]